MSSALADRRRGAGSRPILPCLVLPFCAFIVVGGTAAAHAQETTGKVQGRVTDVATGEPIAGARIRVENSTLGNLTNEQGFYFVNEVPAGLQDIEAEFLGYRAVVVESERILAGQTTTINFELEQTAVELEAIVVEGDRNPLLPRDQVSTKSIVEGRVVDELPVDNTAQVVVLQPGVYDVNCDDSNELDGEFDGRCVSIRGGRPNEEALYIDGALVRSFGTGAAQNVAIPTNALEQVDVTVGGFAAEFGEAQSGVISYVTRTGGRRLSGSLEVATDALAPESWSTDFNRLEANFGGPIAGPLTFFVAGTLTARSFFDNADGPGYWLVEGTDTCPSEPQFSGLCTAGESAVFRLPRSSAGSSGGATDSVDIAAPAFTLWNGRAFPYSWSDSYLFTGNLNWQLPRGSRVTFGYTRNRFQDYSRGGTLNGLYRTDNVDGSLEIRDMFTLGSFLTLHQSATNQVALDVRLSYQSDRMQAGAVDGRWFAGRTDPIFGFTPENVQFHIPLNTVRQGLQMFDPGALELQAHRSGTVLQDSTAFYPGSSEILGARQTAIGLAENLRSNPYGRYERFWTTGPGTAGLQSRNEDRLQARASLDWQIGRFNRLKVGGEYIDIGLQRADMWLFFGIPSVNLAAPKRAGAFLQNRLDLGDLVLEAGIRFDYLDPNVDYPRVPGFEGGNVPDSLQAGYVVWNTNEQAWKPKWGDQPCGGVTEENPQGTCLSNWIPATTKSEWSPRLGASFPVTPTSTFRLSYGRFVQTPAFYGGPGVLLGPLAASQAGLWEAGQDTDLPSTTSFEFGYRQLIGRDLVIDISAFNKQQREALTYRSLPYEDPNNPGFIVYQDVLTNDDFTESTGFEVRLDKAFGSLFVGNLSYTYLDAQGTGWDPWTYVDLIGNAGADVGVGAEIPVTPPAVLLPLESARRHKIAFTSSLQLPYDYQSGTLAGSILSDVGVFTIFHARSGQRFTKLETLGRTILTPPTSGSLAESSFGALEMPWQFEFDLRLTKGFRLGSSVRLQAFLDWRNPFDIAVTEYVFAETGDIENALAMERWVGSALSDPRLDGDTEIRSFDIAAESADNSFNTYMLMRAEQRFGNGDGVFSVEEQTTAFSQDWEFRFGEEALRPSNQSLRLGLRLGF